MYGKLILLLLLFIDIVKAVEEYDYSDYDENQEFIDDPEDINEQVTFNNEEDFIKNYTCHIDNLQKFNLIKALNLLSSHLGTAVTQIDNVAKTMKNGPSTDKINLLHAEQWEEWGDGDNKQLCNSSKIDTIFATGFDTYTFRGNLYWKVSKEGIVFGYPRKIQDTWKELPSNIDGAFTARDSYITYFFKGYKVWAYKDFKLQETYPRPIRSVFRGIPDNIDDVVVWSGNGRPYFFKGDKCYRHHTNTKIKGGKTIELNVTDFRGVPNNIDAGFLYTDGFTYFFKDDEYYRYDDIIDKVAIANPAYPRPTGFYWFGCRTGSLNSEK